ncbi:MAG: leucine-rich repeat domain-containing protein, partial [Oscillospiraceae bacterium]|nr:leucine-rich repeat domain-containing protein [Oscillospiraceae bacterium]
VSGIDGMAFKGCTGLADADGFIIVQGWLYGCAGSPEELMIPAGVTHIQSAAFEKAASLRSVILPEGVVSIGDHAFKDCVNLCTVVLPDSLEEIGDRAFCGCKSLRSVTIPAGVSRVGQHAFARCTSLTSISFPEDAWVDRDVIFRCAGLADEKGFVMFRGHLSSYVGTDTHVVLPDGVRSVNPFAFESCPQITDITLPESGVETDLPSLLLEHLPKGVRLQIPSLHKENRKPLLPPQKPEHPNK